MGALREGAVRETSIAQNKKEMGLAALPAVHEEQRALGALMTAAKRAELQARLTRLQQGNESERMNSGSAPLSPALLAQITELPDIG